jgi:hypothetical protein
MVKKKTNRYYQFDLLEPHYEPIFSNRTKWVKKKRFLEIANSETKTYNLDKFFLSWKEKKNNMNGSFANEPSRRCHSKFR